MQDEAYSVTHQQACERGEKTYIDPETGYMVFTRLGLLERDRCCGAGCRHCPFEHDAVPVSQRSKRIQQAAWLTDRRADNSMPATILFWSGGKDSFLAYRQLLQRGDGPIVLLTTFDVRTRVIAHQEFSIDHVVEHALHLDVPLIGVPLHPDKDYLDHIDPALALVPDVASLAFGDLHLENIKSWREEVFAGHAKRLGMTLEFPIWHVDYSVLLDELEESGAICTISAADPGYPEIRVGERFTRQWSSALPDQIDRFGENGEFHTRIDFESAR